MDKTKMTAHQLEITEKMDIITDALQKYLPSFWDSINYRMDMISALLDNKEYLDDFVDFIQYMEDLGNADTIITQTLMHDLGGLMKKDEDFLPRVCTSGRYNINVI